MAANAGETTLWRKRAWGAIRSRCASASWLFWRTNRWKSAGLGAGPNPYDLLNAALGACKTMTIRLYANRKAWPLKHVEVAVRHRRAELNARDVFEVDVTLQGDLDESQRARLMEIAERCPVSITLTRGSDVHTVLKPATADLPHPTEGVAHMKCMEESCAD